MTQPLDPTPWVPFTGAVVNGPSETRWQRELRGGTIWRRPEWRWASGRVELGHWLPEPQRSAVA